MNRARPDGGCESRPLLYFQRFLSILPASPKVAEGVWTSRVVADQARVRGIEMPIAMAVARVLFEGQSPQIAVQELLERDPKAED